nr:UvrD-helicase domain-containing protein [uncultured Novosphingobium sp.]
MSVAEACEWVSRFLDPYDTGEDARIRPLLSLLCETGDVGFGSVRDEQVLIALPERRVELPDGRVIGVGDHGLPMSDEGAGLFPDAASPSTSTHSLLEYLQEIDDGPPPHIERPVAPSGTWAEAAKIPKELSRALALCGNFDPATTSWCISDVNASFINDWFGVQQESESSEDAVGPDPEQQRVIEATANARLVVEAAPGSGKTFVACARIASLVERGEVVPSRVLVLSFTRVAVAELRDRVAALKSSTATSAIHTRTFDAFAARLLGAAGQSVKGGHDASIRAATRLLVRQDPLVHDIVSGLEHVVIDEAQDLVGDRKAFCDALLDTLSEGCGVTVLGDPAQAIYGYQATDGDRRAFIETICDHAGFSVIRLEQDHRTRTPALGEMFAGCRERLLLPAPDKRIRYFEVRDRIQAAAVESGLLGFAGHASTTHGLILTRGRGALITAAEAMRYQGRKFRIRVPDRPLHIEAWIGATLGGLPGNERISRDGFAALFDELTPACGRDLAECWEILRELEGATGPYVVVSNIASALEDPILEIVRDHEGNAGPLLSTIHAIKGRESDRVFLLLTKAPTGDDVDWDEEARTLYVGATRASAELRTGWITPTKYFRSGGRPERYWAPRAGYRMLEIGLDGDLLSWADLVKDGVVVKPRETVAAIWAAARAQSSIRAMRSKAGQYILSLGGENSPPLGCLSATFLETMSAITKVAPESPGPDAVDAIMVSGATTVFSAGVTGNSPPIGLMPLLSGFCRVDR